MPACSSHKAPMPKLFTLGISVLVSSIRNLHAQKWHSHHQATQGTMEHECSPQKSQVSASLPQVLPVHFSFTQGVIVASSFPQKSSVPYPLPGGLVEPGRVSQPSRKRKCPWSKRASVCPSYLTLFLKTYFHIYSKYEALSSTKCLH